MVWARCKNCRMGLHRIPPRWHHYADGDLDVVQTALDNGNPDPRKIRCGCECADAPSLQVVR